MCGITGIIKKDYNNRVSPERLKRCTDSLIHRGPDAEGFHISKNIGLGHRRLKIIDLTSGAQPMIDEDNGNIIVFNGEIYNYIEVREKLFKKGHKFRTSSDTEVILKAYVEWGEDASNYLNGMWAFAIYDNSKNTMFISRDRVGEKPLFYYENNEELIFASEIKAILSVIDSPQINLDFLQAYLINLNVPAPYTFYKDIFQLMPGTNMVIQNGKKSFKKYWELPNIEKKDLLRDKGKVIKTFEELFEDSVKIRMRSDVEFGAFLSGGLDSSLIVSTMSKISSNDVHTFTMGFNNKEYDERDLAGLVAKQFNTKHTEEIIDINDINNPVEIILKYFDQPFGDSSAIPTYFISQKAKKHITMVLTGDGGDEVLSGYKTYKKLELLRIINKSPKFVNSLVKKGIHLLSLYSSKDSVKNLYSLSRNISEDYNRVNLNNRISNVDYNYLDQFIKDNYKESNQFSIIDYYRDIIDSSLIKEPFYQQMRLNFYNDLPNDYLVKVDRMSMASSLETRTPFLDYRLIELLSTVDKKIKYENHTLKSVLRNSSLGKKLPEEVLQGKKTGFSIPLKEFNNEYLKKTNSNIGVKGLSHSFNENRKYFKVDENLVWASLVLNRFLKTNKIYD